jgi:hypothetical protein
VNTFRVALLAIVILAPIFALSAPRAAGVSSPASRGAAPAPATGETVPAPQPEPEPMDVAPVEQPLDVAAFNRRLAAARDSTWARAAATVAIEFVGGAACECARFSVDVDAQPERFDEAQVTVIRDGLLDDSLRGDRHRLHLRRVKGRWNVEAAHRSWRCTSGRGQQDYGITPCQ